MLSIIDTSHDADRKPGIVIIIGRDNSLVRRESPQTLAKDVLGTRHDRISNGLIPSCSEELLVLTLAAALHL